MRWIEVILSLSGGRIYCLFFCQSRNGGEQRLNLQPLTTTETPSLALSTRFFSLTFVIASVVSRNEVLCVRIQLAKVYFDIYTAQLSTVLKYSDTYHLCTLNVIFQIAFC